LGILLWRLRLGWPGIAFALFVAAALPMLGVVPFYFQWISTVGDRYIYLSMIGPALAVAWLLSLPRLSARPRITAAVYCSVIALLGCISYRQVETWHTSGSVFRQALAVNPRSARTYSNLGTVLSTQGKLAAAVAAYQKSLALNPNQSFAQFNLGAILLRQGRLNEAQPHLEAAARLAPADPDSHTDLGILYRLRGQSAEAAAEFQTSLRLADSPYVHNHLGLVYERTGHRQKAATEYETALRMQPQFASARQNLNRVLALPAGGVSY
jgi:tetratricopeptide (TPR) repeat protein